MAKARSRARNSKKSSRAKTSAQATQHPEAKIQPSQARAHEMVECILDTCAQLVAEQGVAATTTNAVAKVAGISIGSVYRYFPNKQALYAALMERYRLRLHAAVQNSLKSDVMQGSIRQRFEHIFDAFVEFYRHEPGYRQLWLGSQLPELLERTGEAWFDDFAPIAEQLLNEAAPRLKPVELASVARVVITTMSQLVTEALGMTGPGGDALISEAKLMLGAYLEVRCR